MEVSKNTMIESKQRYRNRCDKCDYVWETWGPVKSENDCPNCFGEGRTPAHLEITEEDLKRTRKRLMEKFDKNERKDLTNF